MPQHVFQDPGSYPVHPIKLDRQKPVSASPAPATASTLVEAWSLLQARVGDVTGGSGESIVAHARGTLALLESLRVDEPTRVAAVLFGLGDRVPASFIESGFGAEVATLVAGMRQLLRLKDLTLQTRLASSGLQRETLRRMMLAMATDIRVVLIRLASRLQTLRWHAESRTMPAPGIAHETLEILAPLANRLGLGQFKWELEDLAFRFLEPELYKSIARQLEERRVEREAFIQTAVERLRAALAGQGIEAEVSGRPKHIHSIYNKMRAKGLRFAEVQDLRAFRVIVPDVRTCYTVLGLLHEMWPPLPREFDDYISRPKPNGYQSLHTVVVGEDGRPLEIQVRTREMHQHAEFGVASHWRYKESSTGLVGAANLDSQAPEAQRIGWMRQLLAWQQEVGETLGQELPPAGRGTEAEAPSRTDKALRSPGAVAARSDLEHESETLPPIYVLTPQARVVELPAGSTPIDFAYHVHTELGHRCRGARVDAQMVSLQTALKTGQTVEIIAVRAGSGSEGPSRDWLNPQLGYVRSQRARNKVRQWFNAIENARDLASGREKVERALQREGRTALGFDELASRLRFDGPDPLFLAVARDEVGPRALEEAIRGQGVGVPEVGDPGAVEEAQAAIKPPRVGRSGAAAAAISVVGVDFLMTQLARCCRPLPPDPIVGFVTRGRGVSVHRAECRSFAEMARRSPERVLQTDWTHAANPSDRSGQADMTNLADNGRMPASSVPWTGSRPRAPAAIYPADVFLRARDRQGLLRDVSDVFARDRINVTAVQTVSRDGLAQMQFTVEVASVSQLEQTLRLVREVSGVIGARRR